MAKLPLLKKCELFDQCERESTPTLVTFFALWMDAEDAMQASYVEVIKF